MAGLPIVEIRPPNGRPLLVVVSRRLEIGRECDGVVVDDPLLSRRHLALEVHGDEVLVEDLGSRNGTELDGVVIGARVSVAPGRVLVAGDTQVRITHLVAAAQPTPTRSEAPAALRATIDPFATGLGGPTGPPTTIRTVAARAVDDPNVADRVAGAPHVGTTVTFLFSDIESSTSRTQAIGDRAWYAHLSAHNQIVERQIGAHGGTVVKSIGDGYMATFGSAVAAAKASIAIQQALAARPIGPADDPVRVRIGLHTGEAITVGGDLFGLHVTMASRVADQARGGQILVSSLTRAVVEVTGEVRFATTETIELKGLDGEHQVSELAWSPTSA